MTKIRLILKKIKFLIAKAMRILLHPAAIRADCDIDSNAKICPGSQINNTTIGRFSYLGYNCFTDTVSVGAFCSIADNCRIGGYNHSMDAVSTSPVFEEGKNCLRKHFSNSKRTNVEPIVIENDVWIGANVIVIQGVRVCNGAVIGAGSVVTHNIPPYEVWGGNPAHFIRKRFDDATIDSLQKIAFWDWDEKMLNQYGKYMSDPQVFIEMLKEES